MANSSNRILLANYLNGQGLGNKNYVLNNSAHLNTTYGITLGAGVSAGNVTRNTTTPITAISDFQIAFDSATNEYVSWTLGTLDRADLNGNCQFSGSYKLSLGSGATVQAQVLQGSNTAATLDLAAASTATRFSINVPCADGSSATTVRFAQTVSTNASTLNVADLYYGRALNIGSADVTTQWADYTPTYNTGSWTTNLAKWRRRGSSMEVQLKATNTSAGSGAYTFSIPSVNATINTTSIPTSTIGNAITSHTLNGGPVGAGNWTLSSNFQAYGDCSVYVVSTTAVSVLCGSAASSALNASGNAFTDRASGLGSAAAGAGSSAYATISFSVPINEWQSEIVYRPETQQTAATYYVGSNQSVTAGNFINYDTKAYDFASAVTTGASWKYTAPITGIYRISLVTYNSGATPGLQLYKNGAITSWMTSGVSNQIMSGSTSIQLQAGDYLQIKTDTTFTAVATLSSGNVNLISIENVSASMNAPVLVGSVTSNSIGAERIERVQFGGASELSACTSSPCTIYRQSGSWVTSVTRNGTGDYTVNIASGMFSDKPQCSGWGSDHTTSATSIEVTSAGNVTSTSFRFLARKITDSSSADSSFSLICMGPR